MMIGWVQMLRQFRDLAAVPFGVSLSILTVFYATIVSECILRPAARRIEAELAKDNRRR
jgi:hypothetical protein